MPVRRRSWLKGGTNHHNNSSNVSSGMGYGPGRHHHHHHHHNIRGAAVGSATHGRRRRYHRNNTTNHTVGVRPAIKPTPQPGDSMKQEVSVCVRSMSPSRQTASTVGRPVSQPQLPLRVVLPPEKVVENKSARLLTMDQNCNKKLNDSETTDDNNKAINVEEFACGVSVAGCDKQEWSFTLYDFDGNGKITKEDLGSLLRSLYDAVGSSINLPKSGTKTLKLRLTVSPDNSKVTGSAGVSTGSAVPGAAHGMRQGKDKNITKETNNKTKEIKLNKDLDNSKLSGKDLKLDNISKAEQLNLEVTAEPPKVHHKEVKNNLSNPGKPQPTQSECVGTGPGGVHIGADGKPTQGKSQLTNIEQRHLAELVQRNMERHQQRQQQRHQHRTRREHRKHHSFSTGTGNNRPTGVIAPHTCEESRDRRNYYLDLAGIENDELSRLHNLSAPADILSPCLGKRDHGHRSRDAKLRSRSHNARRQILAQKQAAVSAAGEGTLQSVSVAAAVVDGGDVTDAAPHQRSRSHDIPHGHCKPTTEEQLAAEMTSHRTWMMERSVEEKVEKGKNITLTTTSPSTMSPQSPPPVTLTSPLSAPTPNVHNSKNVHRSRPVSLPPNMPDTVSPHHHRRHRNRERNRKLAMQQVAEWIEREHAWNAATGKGASGGGGGTAPAPLGDKAQAHGTGACAAGEQNSGAAGPAERVILQRHEHHHVHEHHHHHHYHHYHET